MSGLPLQRFDNERQAICTYFNTGLQYKTIVDLLAQYHNVNLSLRTLKRRIAEYGLKKKGNDCLEHVRSLIGREINGPSSQLGYRGMWHLLRTMYGISIPRDDVASILKWLDPEGTERRKSRRLHRRQFVSAGPNSSWHIDGYDKLKPYGFPIHGAVDGFSRRVLWLRVVRTNNDPVVPAGVLYICFERIT